MVCQVVESSRQRRIYSENCGQQREHTESVMATVIDIDQYTIQGYNDQSMRTVPDIHKRHMAKLEVQVCGNEGTIGDRKRVELRKLFKAAIDQIQKENPAVWKNAKVVIQDTNGQSITITAEGGAYTFTVQHNMKGEIEVYRKGNPIRSTFKVYFMSLFCSPKIQLAIDQGTSGGGGGGGGGDGYMPPPPRLPPRSTPSPPPLPPQQQYCTGNT